MHSSDVRLGIRAHDLGCFPADVLASRVAANGLECVQLALAKAIEGIDLSDGRIDAGLPATIRDAFQENGVGIEVLGCYINPIHPDRDMRNSLHDLFKEHLRKAPEFGCGLVALESGSLNADYSPHPDNGGEPAFHELLDCLGALVEEADRCGVVVGIEAVTSHVVSTPKKMRRLLDGIPSSSLKVVFDPVNLLSTENHLQQEDLVRESLDLFGDRITAIHAKDFRPADDGLTTVPAGSGSLKYGPLLAWAAANHPKIAVLLEEIEPDRISGSRNFLLKQLCPPVS